VHRPWALYAALFAIGLVVYGLFAWDRIGRQSGSPHFVYQADAWLHGELAIRPSCGPCGPDLACDPEPPPCTAGPPLPHDDWAFVETVTLRDGAEARGRRLMMRKAFRTLDGREIPSEDIASSRGLTAYVSFPPVPSLIMLPGVLVSGRGAGDVIPTLVVAALILPLSLLVLRRLAEAGLSARTPREDLWLVAMLAFGTVLFFSSVQGKVWYTAHVVGVALALVYAWASIEARRPVIAGVALGLAALTRTSMAFMFPLFVLEAWRMASRGGAEGSSGTGAERAADPAAARRRLVRPLLEFAAPIAAFAAVGMLYNHARFGSPLEFGHTYLALGNQQPVYQQTLIEQWGLAHYHYLSRNLAVALTGLPDVMAHAPWIQINGHGLALWFTTPALLLLLWPRQRIPLHRALLLTAALVALPSLLYMNSGWFQFGYRFSLDYMVFLVMLLAIGGRPLTRGAKGLIIAGIVINAFGAATFDRQPQFYRGAINVVVSN
jgi:hypothetical protein